MPAERSITIHHSPDADDAFMFHGLVTGAVTVPGFSFRTKMLDIESLNHEAREGKLDCTAVSVHAYAYLSDRYAITTVGASFGGENYGPRIVALEHFDLKSKKDLKIGIPGTLTSAALALRMYLHDHGIAAELVNLNFDRVQHEVRAGTIDAGVIIHEGQITLEREGMPTLLDLGAWWWKTTGLPLPLGVNIVNRALGADGMKAAAVALHDTIAYSLEHREEALAYAMTFGRGLSVEDADTYVGMYVNERTLDLGDEGRRSIKLFLERGFEAGIITKEPSIDFVDWR